MKPEIMAEGPRCKRRKQANPRRKNGTNTHTDSHTDSHIVTAPDTARPAGLKLSDGTGRRCSGRGGGLRSAGHEDRYPRADLRVRAEPWSSFPCLFILCENKQTDR